MPEMPDPAPSCEIDFRVRYAEADRMGVVHHSRYWVYFEMGRTELLRQQGMAYADLEDQGVFLVVARCAARFRAPARYDEVLALSTRVTRTGASRVDHAYEVRRKADGVLICTAETTLACVDGDGQIIPLPDGLRGQKGKAGLR